MIFSPTTLNSPKILNFEQKKLVYNDEAKVDLMFKENFNQLNPTTISHKRSNSQGQCDLSIQMRKKIKKHRGLAQKIILPKNNSFLTKTGTNTSSL